MCGVPCNELSGMDAIWNNQAAASYTQSTMAKLKRVAGVIVLCLMAVPARAEVQLTIRDGLVSLNAREATLSEILAEWERVGQTKIFNKETIPPNRLTLQFTDVSEQQALETLLRPLSGYLVAPRTAAVAGASR